ncbi:MAG: hypothetical protein WD875_13465 [Pirellulales bacterium]
MNRLGELLTTILADKAIGSDELDMIGEAVVEDGKLDLDDVKLLVELYCAARDRDPAFDNVFFDTLEHVMLEDGEISPTEQFYLLKMIYSDHEILPREREFLTRIRAALKEPNEDFEKLYETAMAADSTNWSVGGR